MVFVTGTPGMTTWAGALLAAPPRGPSSPLSAPPHDHTVPSLFSATPFPHPAPTAVMPVRPLTSCGVFAQGRPAKGELQVSTTAPPLPSWPLLFAPQV